MIQPDLKVLVNLGYGDPDYGWSTGPANVPTPIGLFSSRSDMAKLPGLPPSGTEQGFQAFIPSEAETGAPMNRTGVVDSFTTR